MACMADNGSAKDHKFEFAKTDESNILYVCILHLKPVSTKFVYIYKMSHHEPTLSLDVIMACHTQLWVGH